MYLFVSRADERTGPATGPRAGGRFGSNSPSPTNRRLRGAVKGETNRVPPFQWIIVPSAPTWGHQCGWGRYIVYRVYIVLSYIVYGCALMTFYETSLKNSFWELVLFFPNLAFVSTHGSDARSVWREWCTRTCFWCFSPSAQI